MLVGAMVMMVVMMPIPGMIHVLITNPHITVQKLIGLSVRPAQFHRMVLVELGSVHHGELVFGYASVHLDQVEHGDDVCCHHELLGLWILHGTAHLVLEECGWEGRIKASRVEEQAAELGQVHQVKASTQGLTQVLVGHGVVLSVKLLQDPHQEQRVIWERFHGFWLAGAGLQMGSYLRRRCHLETK